MNARMSKGQPEITSNGIPKMAMKRFRERSPL